MILFKFFILGILTALIFPPFFMLPLGFIIFPYIINLISKISFKNYLFSFFLNGLFFGLGFFFIFLSWIYNPFLVFQSTKPFAFAGVLLPIFLSLFFGLSFVLYKSIKNLSLIIILTVFIFLLTEYFISNLLYGFPWFSYSLILSNNFLGFYLIKYFGTFTSSFLIISIFIIPSFIYNFKKFKKNSIFILCSYLPFLFIIFIPLNNLFSNNDKLKKELSLDIYQINSPIENLNRKIVEKKINKIINSSTSDYIIFAENNYPYTISKNNYLNLFKNIKDNKKVIIGVTREENNKFYNSFLLLEEDKLQYFDKKILVPFGEFLPFRRFLKFMEKISGFNDFQKGTIDRLLSTKDNVRILPVICYEITFDSIFKNINNSKIDLIINITNDSWFGSKVGPYQHFYLTRLKSLIANKPIIRVSNNGISAIINQNGKIIKFSKLNEENNLKFKLIIKKSYSYYFIHQLFSLYVIFLFLFFLIFNKFRTNE